MPADAGLLAVQMLLAAFAGGAIGAAIGPLPSLSIAGLAVVVGEVQSATGSPESAIGVAPETAIAGNATATSAVNASQPLAAAGSRGMTALIGLGPALGPHVAFAGGVAATAYAGRKGYLDTDFEYHEAKHITAALGSRPDVLVVGGIFGIVGYWLTQLSVQLGLPWEPVAVSVVLSGVLHRIVFGYPIVGSLDSGLLDMTPFEEGERRMAADGSETGTISGRLVVEPWLPATYEWPHVGALGLVVGLFGGFVAVATGSYYLAFGLAVATLLFLATGIDRFPVTHHMALPASIATLALPQAGPAVAILVGGLFGILGGLVGELAQRAFYAHADTHLDPSFISILVTSVLIALLDAAGLFAQSAIPTVGLT